MVKLNKAFLGNSNATLQDDPILKRATRQTTFKVRLLVDEYNGLPRFRFGGTANEELANAALCNCNDEAACQLNQAIGQLQDLFPYAVFMGHKPVVRAEFTLSLVTLDKAPLTLSAKKKYRGDSPVNSRFHNVTFITDWHAGVWSSKLGDWRKPIKNPRYLADMEIKYDSSKGGLL